MVRTSRLLSMTQILVWALLLTAALLLTGSFQNQAYATPERDSFRDSFEEEILEPEEAEPLEQPPQKGKPRRRSSAKKSLSSTVRLDPAERYARRTTVLNHFLQKWGVSEPNPGDGRMLGDVLGPLAGQQSRSGIEQRLRYLDIATAQGDSPSKGFQGFIRIENSSSGTPVLRVFKDLESRQHLDFEIPLMPDSGDVAQRSAYRDRLLQISSHARTWKPWTWREIPDWISGKFVQRAAGKVFVKNEIPPYRPSPNPKQMLEGVRILLDPGHMGGEEWDRSTGKMIWGSRAEKNRKKGRFISEGALALVTASLLREELQKLGAEVRLTREGLSSVRNIQPSQLPSQISSAQLQEMKFRELDRSSMESWFDGLISSPRFGPSFMGIIEGLGLFAKKIRKPLDWYYANAQDLRDRAEEAREFKPDLTLVIHYDASLACDGCNYVNPKIKQNFTKAYVAGGFMPHELSTRRDRVYFVEHLMNRAAWDASVQLSRSIVGSLSQRLGIEPATYGGSAKDSVTLEKGVFARNWLLSRKLTGHAAAYLEVLFYNEKREFGLLLPGPHSPTIEVSGARLSYTPRVQEVVEGIRDGILEFLKGYR